MTYSDPTIQTQAYEQVFVRNQEVILHTTIYPRANAETVILLHGGPGVPDPMSELALELNRKYQVINFEQRGTGASSNPNDDYSMASYISDIDAIASHFELNTFHLFGHSWGGLYAQIYAAAKPERLESLFLCSPSSGTNTTWQLCEREVMQFNQSATSGGEWMVMGWNSLLGMLGSDRAYQRLFYQVLKNYHQAYPDIEINREQLGGIKAKPVNKTRKAILAYPELSPIANPSFPVMIAYGSNDIYQESKEEVSKRFPTARAIEIEDAGHIPWLHQPLAFGELLDGFYGLVVR